MLMYALKERQSPSILPFVFIINFVECGQHIGALASTVASQQEDPGFDFNSGCGLVLLGTPTSPQSKDMYIRLTDNFKLLSVGESMRVDDLCCPKLK